MSAPDAELAETLLPKRLLFFNTPGQKAKLQGFLFPDLPGQACLK
jgi:hypothetical protein